MVWNNRGQLMSLFFVFMTVFFIGIVLFLFIQEQSVISGSIASPVEVLEYSDASLLFGVEEYGVLRELYCDGGDVGVEFCSRFSSLTYSSFLLDNTIPLRSSIASGDFCSSVYSFIIDSDSLLVERSGLVKRGRLEGVGDLNFPVSYEFTLEKQYLLTLEDCS